MENVSGGEACDTRSEIRFYPEWSTYTAKEGDVVWTLEVIRFGLLIDPLEMTGSFLAVSQYPVFKVQAAAGTPAVSCGFTHRVPSTRSRRRGGTLLARRRRVNTLFTTNFVNALRRLRVGPPGDEKAPRIPERRERSGHAAP